MTPQANIQRANEKGDAAADLPSVREIFQIGALFVGVLLSFFSTPILRHEVLSPADLLMKSEPWRQAAPDFEPASALLSDSPTLSLA